MVYTITNYTLQLLNICGSAIEGTYFLPALTIAYLT